ncbi:MAG: TVP38/TMEM64 family protein [Alphaproteobacteria bacterium]
MRGTTVITEPSRAASPLKRFLPIIILVAGLVVFFALGLDDYVGFDVLRENRMALADNVAANSLLASLIFMAVYAVAIAFSIPGGAILTLVGGFLFGIVWGGIMVVVSATIGATCLFLAARTALGDTLRRKAGPWMAKLEGGFKDSAVSYLFTLRLIPIFPFWLVNLVPAFFGVSLGIFVLTTLLGIIPGTLVYISVGNGLGATLDAGSDPDLGIIFRPAIFLPLIGLAVLSLVPVIYKKVRARRA